MSVKGYSFVTTVPLVQSPEKAPLTLPQTSIHLLQQEIVYRKSYVACEILSDYYRMCPDAAYHKETVVALLRTAVTYGSAKSLVLLALCYIEGYGVLVNYILAFRYLSIAYRLKVTNAAFYLGVCYLRGYGTSRDLSMTRNLFEEEIKTNKITPALCWLAHYYLTSKCKDRDDTKGVNYLNEAAQLGELSAIQDLIYIYQNGINEIEPSVLLASRFRRMFISHPQGFAQKNYVDVLLLETIHQYSVGNMNLAKHYIQLALQINPKNQTLLIAVAFLFRDGEAAVRAKHQAGTTNFWLHLAIFFEYGLVNEINHVLVFRIYSMLIQNIRQNRARKNDANLIYTQLKKAFERRQLLPNVNCWQLFCKTVMYYEPLLNFL